MRVILRKYVMGDLSGVNVVVIDTVNLTSHDLKILSKFEAGQKLTKPTFNTGVGGYKAAVPIFKLGVNDLVNFGFYLALSMIEVKQQSPAINVCEVIVVEHVDTKEQSYGAIFYVER